MNIQWTEPAVVDLEKSMSILLSRICEREVYFDEKIKC
jgi:hypothetical protein